MPVFNSFVHDIHKCVIGLEVASWTAELWVVESVLFEQSVIKFFHLKFLSNYTEFTVYLGKHVKITLSVIRETCVLVQTSAL